jgi:hypothetical protein
MRVTFDTNTLEKATRPERSVKDPLHPEYVTVHQAVTDGRIAGFFSETIISLEGIQKTDRSAVLGGTTMSQQEQITEHPATGQTVVTTTFTVKAPLRTPLHPEVAARIRAARNLGMRLLRAPRLGGYLIDDPDGTVFAVEPGEAALEKRLRIYHSVLRKLDARAIGFAQIQQLASTFAARANVQEPWFQSLHRATDVHEKTSVIRAVAEWADGDSIAAHVGYGLDCFCTGDEGKSSGAPSVFDAANRAWLTATYGTRFATMAQLAAMV